MKKTNNKKYSGYKSWAADMDNEMDGYRTETEKSLDDIQYDISNIFNLVSDINDHTIYLSCDIKEAKTELTNMISTDLVYVIGELKKEIKKNKISSLSELIILSWGIYGLIQMYKYYF